jgi:glycosyltransferase involved in cell wall biosynthesis
MTFEAENVDSLAEVILELASDHELRENIGHAGKEFIVNNRTWVDIVHLYNDVYQRY